MSIFKGRLKNLNEEQGYGVISTPDAAGEVRFDLKDLEHYGTPWIGEKLVFSLKPGVDGHFRAVRVKPTATAVGNVRINRIKSSEYAYVIIPFIGALIACTFSVIPLLLYITMSLLAGYVVTLNQHHQKRRINKHSVALAAIETLGGWPGSVLSKRALNIGYQNRKFAIFSLINQRLHILLWAGVAIMTIVSIVS
ncbi:hypothetical protein [Neptunomonas sp. XY-337]|uniref:hypothetical protein n=1 Tax=Neptunomonas sp. XY-337 TaxID=2561897 RepID=UPI0010AAD4AC|nr:hypothetical protein [Neptunomonas sp. XY-337]